MSDIAIASDEQLFDVTVRLPSGAKLEAIEQRALDEAGMAPEKVEALVKALRSVPFVKVGASVSKERADRARVDLGGIGLVVEVTAVLGLTTKEEAVDDGSTVCPACEKRIVLPANRQCPACHVFVDKVNEEFLLRRKIMEQEKARAEYAAAKGKKDGEKKTREALEAALRKKIRDEVEKEFGLKDKSPPLFSGRMGRLLAGVGVLGVAGAAFVAGRGTDGLPGLGGSSAKATAAAQAAAAPAGPPTPKDVDKMLDDLGTKGASASGDGPVTDDEEALLKSARNGGPNAKGLSMDQAVAASMTLAKAVGNTTAERAMAGGPGAPGKPGAPGAALAGTGTGAVAATGAPTSAAGAAPGIGGGLQAGAASATSAAPAAADATVPVSNETKWGLTAELAVQLAEMGQVTRALGVIQQLKTAPGVAASVAMTSIVLPAEAEVQAWAIGELPDGKARARAETLRNEVGGIPSAAERALAFARVGAILAEHRQLPSEVSLAFMTLASDSLKMASDIKARDAATGPLMVALGQALAADVASKARAGLLNRAADAAGRLAGIVKQAPTPASSALLLAVQSRSLLLLGDAPKADQTLAAALKALDRIPSGVERAATLRKLASLAEAGRNAAVQAASARLQAAYEGKSGLERAQVLSSLSLLNAEAGQTEAAAGLKRQVQETQGLTPQDTTTVAAEIIVRSDLVTVRTLHAVKAYAEAENLLRKVGGYLL